MTENFSNVLLNMWNDYLNNHKSIVLSNPLASCILYSIFKKLDKNREISDMEKSFIIDYMKEGIMSETEILDYEDLKKKNPDVMLPDALTFN